MKNLKIKSFFQRISLSWKVEKMLKKLKIWGNIFKKLECQLENQRTHIT